ncbi:unnamed protein product [Alopecurus aequalis]
MATAEGKLSPGAKNAKEDMICSKDYLDPPPTLLFDAGELCKWSLYRAVIAEFTATLFFVYVAVATVIGHKRQTDAVACSGAGMLGIAWAFGGMISVLVYCTAGISGGHINPAVTFALLLARKISVPRAYFYMAAQCLGAICGAALVKAVHGAHYYDLYGGGANELAPGYSKSAGLVAETLGTAVLVYTVFTATDPKRMARDPHIPPTLNRRFRPDLGRNPQIGPFPPLCSSPPPSSPAAVVARHRRTPPPRPLLLPSFPPRVRLPVAVVGLAVAASGASGHSTSPSPPEPSPPAVPSGHSTSRRPLRSRPLRPSPPATPPPAVPSGAVPSGRPLPPSPPATPPRRPLRSRHHLAVPSGHHHAHPPAAASPPHRRAPLPCPSPCPLPVPPPRDPLPTPPVPSPSLPPRCALLRRRAATDALSSPSSSAPSPPRRLAAGSGPRRSLGAAVIYNGAKAWNDQWIFWIGPFVGAAIAVVYHEYILRNAAAKSFRSKYDLEA